MRRLSELGRRSRRCEGPPGPPDYIGVGADWSGTTWWHSLLLAHPEIRAPRERALDFFGPFCDREMQSADIARYREHFPRRDGAIGGEWTDRYMADGWVPPLLRRVAPDARLLVMLRDPIESYRASHAERSAQRVAGDRLSMTDAADRRNYASQLARLQRFFDPDRILVLQYERCREDPVGQYRRTLRFLGVRDDFVPWRLRAMAARPQALAVAGLCRLPLAEPVRRRALARLTGLAEPAADSAALWPDLEAALLTTFSPEVEQLLELVPELELSLWPGFTRTGAPPALAQQT